MGISHAGTLVWEMLRRQAAERGEEYVPQSQWERGPTPGGSTRVQKWRDGEPVDDDEAEDR